MGQYSYSQPSSSSAESMHSEQEESRKGLMTRCRCGGLLSLEMKASGENQGRLFYKCGLHEQRGIHESKFWDVAATEEMVNLRKMIVQMEESLDYTYLHRMNKIEDYSHQLSDKFHKTMEDLYYAKRPIGGRLRVFGGAVRRRARDLGKYWLVVTLSVCLLVSLVFNYAYVKGV